MTLARIAARAFDTPLLIEPGKAEAIALGLGARMLGEAISLASPVGAIDHVAGGAPLLGTVGDSLGRFLAARGRSSLDMVDGVAVIAVEGTLVHKGAYIGSSSGETSYEGIQTQVRQAARDPAVRAVVFEVDSYGGEGYGAFETADMIAELSAAKPTLAILTSVAASAGYLLASAARQIVAPQYGQVGSIGALMMHIDRSRQAANAGVQVTYVAAGALKAEGNPFAPLSVDLRQRMQAEVDAMRRDFSGRVGAYRGQRFTAEQAIATEAGVFSPAEALSLGMIDGIGAADAAFAEFIAAVNSRR